MLRLVRRRESQEVSVTRTLYATLNRFWLQALEITTLRLELTGDAGES
jgi:hypothetical protein